MINDSDIVNIELSMEEARTLYWGIRGITEDIREIEEPREDEQSSFWRRIAYKIDQAIFRREC